MADPMTPDPREERQPAWVRQVLAELRARVLDSEKAVASVRGEHPGTNVHLDVRGSRSSVGLPENSHVTFHSKWGGILVGHDLDGRVRIQGDSRLILRVNAANTFTVELEDD